MFAVFLVKVRPYAIVLIIISSFCLFLHENYFGFLSASTFNQNLRQFTAIQCDITEFELILFVHQVNIILISLEKYRWIVVKIKFEKRNLVRISVVCEWKRLLSNFKHHIATKHETDHWRLVFSCLLNFFNNIRNPYINILKAALSLQRHR